MNILEALGAPFSIREKAPRLYQMVSSVLRKVENKILIIDEIHHILAGAYLNQRIFLNVIKYLANDLQIVIIGAGIRDAFSAINTDKQLANRFEPAILPRWKMDDEYLRLLMSFEAMLRLPGFCKPFPNESLSSWLTRLAFNHGHNTNEFCKLVWAKWVNYNWDADRAYMDPIIDQIAAQTNTDVQDARSTLLTYYEHRLYTPSAFFKIPEKWVLPPYRTRKHAPKTIYKSGVLYCPGCFSKQINRVTIKENGN